MVDVNKCCYQIASNGKNLRGHERISSNWSQIPTAVQMQTNFTVISKTETKLRTNNTVCAIMRRRVSDRGCHGVPEVE